MELHISKYFTAQEYFRSLYDRKGRQFPCRTGSLEEYRQWRERILLKLADVTGICRMEKAELAPEMGERTQKEGYSRQKVLLYTLPGVVMPLYMLIPDGIAPGERRPAVIACAGHYSGGKYGLAAWDDCDQAAVSRQNYRFAVESVRQGRVVFCPDAMGFGERREAHAQGDDSEHFLASSCAYLNNMAINFGMSLTGLWVFELMCLVDYIGTLDFCDPSRVASIGMSGGGLQSLWLAALDERVKCCVTSGYFYGVKDALLSLENCSCNYVPGLWEVADMGDLAALVAPRPLLVETGDHDHLNGARGLINVTEQMNIAAGAYTLLGSRENLRHHVFSGDHEYHGGATEEFFQKYL